MRVESAGMSKSTLTRRELAQQALAGAAGMLLAAVSPAGAQVVDPNPAVPLPLPTAPGLPGTGPAEEELLIQMAPIQAGYALTETQTREVALLLRDYPQAFAKARAYALSEGTGPAFAADAPFRKERAQ